MAAAGAWRGRKKPAKTSGRAAGSIRPPFEQRWAHRSRRTRPGGRAHLYSYYRRIHYIPRASDTRQAFYDPLILQSGLGKITRASRADPSTISAQECPAFFRPGETTGTLHFYSVARRNVRIQRPKIRCEAGGFSSFACGSNLRCVSKWELS